MLHFLYNMIIFPIYLIIQVAYLLSLIIFGNNHGFAIILISVLVTILCLPLYIVAEKWQQIERDKQNSMKEMLSVIKSAFKGDERYMMTNAYYREEHYHPIMALRSSFGLLIQIPFFIAAYKYLSTSAGLLGNSFLFIKDLGRPDALFTVGNFGINILPIAMTLINIIAGLIYTKGFSVREKLQIYGMALVFLAILYNSPAGLVLYWTFNNIFSLVKNIFYKFKKPLKVFWICASLVSVAAVVFLILKNARLKHLMPFICLSIFVIAAPLIIRFCKFLNKTILKVLLETNKRHLLYILACTCLALLTGLVIPSNLIGSSPTEFSLMEQPNPLLFIATSFFQGIGFFLFWPVCIYFLFDKKVQTILITIVVGLSICAIINTFVFALNYGTINLDLTFSNANLLNTISKQIKFLNLLVIVLISVFAIFLSVFRSAKLATNIFTIVLVSFLVIGIYNSVKITKEARAFVSKRGDFKTTVEPIFHLSKTEKNVIFIMLDRAQSAFVQEIIKEDPEIAKTMYGFTYYPNTVSFGLNTIIGSAPLYGGYEYSVVNMNRRSDVALKDKQNEALLLIPRILTEQSNFSAVETDAPWANHGFGDTTIFLPYEKINGMTIRGIYTQFWRRNFQTDMLDDNTIEKMHRNLIIFSFFRVSPVVIRKSIYANGTYRDEQKTYTRVAMDEYALLDILDKLTDFSSSTPSYISVDNELTHSPIFLQAPDYVPNKEITNFGTSKYAKDEHYHVNMASLKLLAKYCKFLQENEVYDNTRIIIASDHGGDAKDERMEENNVPLVGGLHSLLLFKDFNAKQEWEEDFTFMTQSDVPSLILKDIVENPINPFTKKAIPLNTTKLKEDGVIVTNVASGWDVKSHNKNTFLVGEMNWFTVKDNIFKAENWKQIEPPVK